MHFRGQVPVGKISGKILTQNWVIFFGGGGVKEISTGPQLSVGVEEDWGVFKLVPRFS